jgi:DNA polymerase-1
MVKAVWDDPYKALFWAKYPTFDSAPPEAKLDYACRDVVYTGLLHTDFIKQLEQENIPDALVKSAHALALALFDTELEGIAIDLNYLADRGVFLSSKILDGKSAINSSIGIIKDTIEMDLWAKELAKKKTPRGWENCKRPEFSVDSSQQIMLLLYKYLKLQTQFNEKTKSPSVDDASLEKLESAHPVVPLLREYRGHQKIYSSYIEGTLERQINGRIYPSFNINGTHTGRISSSNPNMQQLPRDGGIRGIYVPDLGHKFISCDYSQLEVVIAAHYSRDPSLLKIVLEGANQHDITAKGLGIPRPMAKTINFALQYGAGVRKVQSILNCSEKEAKRAFAAYWETYSGVKRLMDECSMLVDNNQPIVNIFGRKRRFPEVFEENWMKAKAKRQAFNFLVQSTGADITHRAYIKMHRTMLDRKWGKALFEVHDEILVMSLEAHVKMTQLTLSETMISIGREAELSVPLKVDCSEPKDRWEK